MKEFKFVKDADGILIKAGDVVCCLDPIEGYLEKGGLYTVQDILNDLGRVSINPDLTGKEGHFNSTRFVVVTNLLGE